MSREVSENLVLKMLVEIRGQITGLDTKLSGRMDGVEAKIDQLTARSDLIEARMSRLERVVHGLGDSVDVVLKNLRVLLATHDPDRLDKIEERLAAISG